MNECTLDIHSEDGPIDGDESGISGEARGGPVDANARQIGGDHYARGGTLQHWDFVVENGLSYLEGNVTKYVCRHRNKNGLQDLQKAEHYMQKLLETETRAQNLNSVRPPRIINLSTYEFAKANDLNEDEFRFVDAIATWETLADLHKAKRILNAIFVRFEQAAIK
jgi:hypothetical protein